MAHSDSAAPPLALVDAAKAFGEVRALDGASFELRQGELVGLLGPNGAGKTTAIRAVSGRVSLDRGTVSLFGRSVSGRDDRPEIGVVPQELAVYPLLSARENLEIFAQLYGVPRATLAARVHWALEWAGLADRATEPVKRYSGGMKRRLNIACGLLHEPRILLLDEPTVGVDPQSRERIYEMLDALQASGVSVLLTTHHLEEAERRCDRIVILDHGRTIASGTVSDLVAKALGGERVLRLRLSAPLGQDAPLPAGASIDDARYLVTMPVADLSADVPAAMQALGKAGAAVADLAVAGATLQDAFIALTGRELRE